jgi:hypothetical protein
MNGSDNVRSRNIGQAEIFATPGITHQSPQILRRKFKWIQPSRSNGLNKPEFQGLQTGVPRDYKPEFQGITNRNSTDYLRGESSLGIREATPIRTALIKATPLKTVKKNIYPFKPAING